MSGMATTDTFTTRSLDEYGPRAESPQSVHTWEHERRGVVVEHSYVLDHVDESCPAYREVAGIGAAYLNDNPEGGWPCSTCWVDTKRGRAIEGPDGDRSDSIDAPESSGGAQATGAGRSDAPSDKAVRLLTALLRGSVAATPEWADGTLSAEDAEGIVWTVAVEATRTRRACSDAIDRLKDRHVAPVWDELVRSAAPAPAAAEGAMAVSGVPVRTNRYAATCAECGVEVAAETGALMKVRGRWEVRHVGGCPVAAAPSTVGLDLSELPAGRYAVPGGTTRLKVQVDKPAEGRWAGYTFVRDAAEYGSGQRYGKAAPGGRYVGQIEDELVVILADPAAASMAYGRLVGRCGICNRHLEDEQSVERGIGPVCAQRMGW